MEILKNKMPTLEATYRAKVFNEVATGYTKEIAFLEAKRCLNCKNAPCINGCPVNINIPLFISKIKDDDLIGAYKVILNTSTLPAICGRVCPQESQCEAKCTMGIKFEPVGIGNLERYVADNCRDVDIKIDVIKNNKKVAVIGSGPSGLSCAYDLAINGFDVTIFEALHTVGGVLVYGIPEFRLPKEIVNNEVNKLKALGVKIKTNVVIGKTLTIEDLKKEYQAIYIGTGAGLPNFMGIPGEGLNGVYSANEFLTRTNLMKAYLDNSATPIIKGGNVAVTGGGNVAMDAARCALRLGANKVYVIYRRSEKEMPARKEEIAHAKEEGIEFLFLNNPLKINGDDKGFVKSVTCQKMELGAPDERGRCRPLPIIGSEYDLDINVMIIAIGTSPNPLIKNTTKGLETNQRGGIIINDEGLTSLPFIYAGGDAVTGAATVISAMGAGKVAAKAIIKALN